MPPYALAFALRGTRRTFGRHLGVDDLPTHLEIQARQATQTEAINVAVVYGAGHMPAVTHELLRRYGYRPRTAEWLTVFDF